MAAIIFLNNKRMFRFNRKQITGVKPMTKMPQSALNVIPRTRAEKVYYWGDLLAMKSVPIQLRGR